MARVVIENVYKSFPQDFQHRSSEQASNVGDLAKSPATGQLPVLRSINLTVEDGEFLVLVGASGCGKSTLLRLIAGLEAVTAGNIWVGERRVNDLPAKARDIAMVFQSYALYPHLTVYDNLAFGLRRTGSSQAEAELTQSGGGKVRDRSPKTLPTWAVDWLAAATRSLPSGLRYWSPKERWIDQRVRSVAKMLQIEMLLNRLPKQLSGGQKQRVALGRAMARNPAVFLMDEPLSNLDAKLRTETRAQIVNLQRQVGITTIYVTHDQIEAMTMGDRIAVMHAGQIQQLATPLDLYHYPANQYVAGFIGSPPMNFLPVQFKAPLLLTHDQFRLTLPDAWADGLKIYDGRSLTLGIRPEHLTVSVAAPKNLPVRIVRIEALGNETFLVVTLLAESGPTSTLLQVRISPDLPVAMGETIWLAMTIEKLHLFDPATGLSLRQAH